MPASSLSISMFHRRLLMISALMVVVVIVLVTQLGRLTLAKGAELRSLAESKLVNLEWKPTTRGRILDRQGRVVAKDRPSFDITVDYRVISGEWASAKGASVAKKLNRQRWNKMAQEEREALIQEYRAPFAAHIEAMWNRFADTARMNREDVDRRVARISGQVEKRYEWVKQARYTKGIDRKLAEGREITEDVEEEILKEVRPQIEEQKAPHVVLPKVDDPVGFAFGKLVGEQVEIDIPKIAGATELSKPWMEPLMPGLGVANAGDREYPMDAVVVDADLSSLPGPMKQAGRKRITVEGVGYHILGRMESNSYADRVVKSAEGVVKTITGHATERADRLKREVKDGPARDSAFAARVLAPEELGVPESMRDLGRYEFNDDSGFGGIEESREAELRGLRGLTVSQLDTGKRQSIEHAAGKDVQLTVDMALQARVQAAMSPEFGLAIAQPWHAHENPTVPPGTELNGAAVVLEVESGDILALVTTPSVSRRVLKNNPEQVFREPLNEAVNMPWLDRAIARPYPPGSIVKALILNGAVKFGKHNLESPIDCNGHLFPDKPNEFRCWIFKDPRWKSTHNIALGHPLSAAEGLMVSCNVYFFTLGQRLGQDGIIGTYSMFGLGQPFDLGVGIEYRGGIGRNGDGRGITIQDAIQMGIGQGPVSWTPLHAADAYATLARGGKRIVPHIVNEPSSRPTEDLGLDPRAVKESLEGLSLSVNDEKGTGNHVDIPKVGAEGSDRVYHFKDLPNIKVWGKTGTAQAPTIFTQDAHKDRNGKDVARHPLYDKSVDAEPIREAARDPNLQFPQGYRALRWGDHSWFVVLVGHQDDNKPLYAIAVMMEYAGSGGKVSGPIVTQIIRAMMTEGYL